MKKGTSIFDIDEMCDDLNKILIRQEEIWKMLIKLLKIFKPEGFDNDIKQLEKMNIDKPLGEWFI